MSGDVNQSGCGGRLMLPFNILALGVAILALMMMRDTLRQKTALEQQQQQAGAQGQQLAAVRQHYFGLYTDLVALSAKDPQAEAIVRKYGIQFNQPPPAPAGQVAPMAQPAPAAPNR